MDCEAVMPPPRTPEDFAAAFTALLTAGGLTVAGVLRHCPGQVSRSTLYDWKNGDHLPEETGPLLAVVESCLERAARRGAALGDAPRDADGWLRLLAEAKRARDTRSTVADPAAGRPVVSDPAAGRPVGRWDPVVLGVHKAIGGGPLPRYVRRVHDDLLYALLDPAVAANRLVALRGGSSTGKSRAAYEAVRARLPHLPMSYPRTGDALARLLTRGVPARSVLWLNELRHYADDPAGTRALFDLADLLGERNHVVAVTTLWPAHWAAYTGSHHGEPYSPDSARATRELLMPLPELTGHDPRQVDPGRGGVVDVPDRFTAEEVARALRDGDTTLEQAATAAAGSGEDGRLAQYLAGVPELLAHWQGPGADPYGQALITAALDAVRLGHPYPLGRELLERAAVGYLSPAHRAVSDADRAGRLDRAWAYATRTLKGAIQALQPVPPEDGIGVAGYRPADYLEHSSRRTAPPPASLWEALAVHATAPALMPLGVAADDRGLYRYAFAFFTAAVEAGERYARSCLAGLFEKTGRTDEAITWFGARADAGDADSLHWLANFLRDAGRTEEAMAAYRRAGSPNDLRWLAGMLKRAGRVDDAIACHREAVEKWGAEQGASQFDLTDLRTLMIEAGRTEELITWLRERAEAGNGLAGGMCARLLEEAGRVAEAIDLHLLSAKVRGERKPIERASLIQAAALLEKSGRVDEAIAIHRRLADEPDDYTALSGDYQTARLLADTGRADEAIAWLQGRAAAGRRTHRGLAVRLLREQGREADAIAWLESLARDGDHEAVVPLTELLEEAGRDEEAICLLRIGARTHEYLLSRLIRTLFRLDRADEAVALCADDRTRVTVAGLLHENGRTDDALALLRASDPEGPATEVIPAILREAGRTGELITYLRERADGGDAKAARRLTSLLVWNGRRDEAITWLRGRPVERDASAGDELAELLRQACRPEDLIVWVAGHPQPGLRALLLAAEALLEAGRTEEAISLYQRAAGLYHSHTAWFQTLPVLTALLSRQGRIDELVTWLTGQAAAGESQALNELTIVLLHAGRAEEALAVWGRYVESGDAFRGKADPPGDFADAFREAGHGESLDRMHRYGIDPGGAPAQPWSTDT
ncbi:hypothetical protein [Spongiactinospora sp. TRM90649]|uniref:tetratricopeptide repeat protein n=1 Tax=Spongiactinospora sp. TRM90649 TaxID=3031114 RepID=UPI0023F8D227|nr:hypothetical protein [Spongiactinospora sp. TRM90649]MDF5751756.1 hypothetical protein [Spongiactinospora sp. TRM90649]